MMQAKLLNFSKSLRKGAGLYKLKQQLAMMLRASLSGASVEYLLSPLDKLSRDGGISLADTTA